MEGRRLRYSLTSLLVSATICVLLASAIFIGPGRWLKRDIAEVLSGEKFTTYVRYGYSEDRLQIEDNKLGYVVIVVVPKGEQSPTIGTRRHWPYIERGNIITEIPKTGQLFEFADGQLTAFTEHIKYSVWIDFITKRKGAFTAEDLVGAVRKKGKE
jgi:hypothetical protein